MKSKEKKQNHTAVIKNTDKSAAPPFLSKKDMLPAVLLSLIIGVEFVPKLGAIDSMGSQWLYLVIVNLAASVLMLRGKINDYYAPVKKICSNTLSLLYAGLFLVAGISIFFALNKTESVVCYVRFATALVTFFNVALLLYGRLHLFRFFARLFTLILLINSIAVLIDFSQEYGKINLDMLVLSLKGNAGNKNILAASLVIKIPFAIYCIYSMKLTGKIISLLTIVLATLAIFIINSRATYLSLGLILLFVAAFCIMNYLKDKNLRFLVQRIGLVLIPVILSFLLSQAILKNALALEGNYGTENSVDKAGTVIQRLSTIDFTAKGSGNRSLQWSSAWDYIKQHPFTGAGYGNWKLASIPYEKTFLDEMFVTMHVHNDFLEITAETGILGGILFFGIFLCSAVYLLKAVFSKQANETALFAQFAFMSLIVYAIDSTFNFPMERPVMQVNFIFILGLCLNIFFIINKKQPALINPGKSRLLFVSLVFILLIPAFYVTALTYKSMVAQNQFANDASSEEYKYSFAEVNAAFPAIPDLDYICFPVDAFKSTYLIKEKKYKEALALLDKSAKVNPALTFNDYLKAKIFIETNQLDSGFYYAHKAFYNKPRAKSNWYLLNMVSSRLNDTLGIEKAFTEFNRYRNDAWAWNEYLSTIIEHPYRKEKMLTLIDSALKLFPGDKLLEQRKVYISQGPEITTSIQGAQIKAAADLNDIGLGYLNSKDYNNAIQNFIKATELNPNNYIQIENTGLCYFFLKDYKTAVRYFDNVLQHFKTTDGKSEFFKGACLTQLGNKKEGCSYLKIADSKHYTEAKKLLDIYCR